MAVIFENLNQNDKAIEYYTKEIEIRPDYFLGYRNRALRYAVDLKDYEKAEADYTKAIELDPENDENYYYRGNFYEKYLEDYDKAIADFTKAIEINPNATNFYNRARFRYVLENYELAISDYLRSLELDLDQKTSKDRYLLNGLAMAYKQLGNLDSAIIYLEKEINISPKNSLAYRNLGDIYVELRQFDKAREIYNNLINVDSKNAQSYAVRAQFFMTDIDDYLSSISDLSKAIELEIDNSDFYFKRAKVYFKIKDYRKALNDFEKSLELNPEITNSEYMYAEIANCYSGIGAFDKALDYYNMEIDLGENADAYSERAMFYDLYLNDFEKANLDFEKAIELAPNTNNIVLQYLNFLYSNKKYEHALEISKKASEIEPKDPQSDYVSALIFMEINKPFQALTHLNSCIQKIIRFSGERYWISDRSNSEVDLSEVFLMRGNFYKNKDKELMCSDYQDALNFTFDENQKAKINSLLLENCGI
jgi:tetratricopeptide (TPR) repeat protein